MGQAQATLDHTLWAAREESACAFWLPLLCRASLFLKRQTGLSGRQAPHPHLRAPLQRLLEKLMVQRQVHRTLPALETGTLPP